MKIKNGFRFAGAALAVITVFAYGFLSFFLPFSFSMDQITSILSACAVLFAISLFVFFNSLNLFSLRKFERELTLFFSGALAFYFLSLLYTADLFRMIGTLKARRLAFIVVDILYSFFACLLVYLLVRFFVLKLGDVQKSLFYGLIFLFVVSVEIPVLSFLFYIFVFIYFLRVPWLIAISHRYRKFLLVALSIFWFFFCVYPFPILNSYELFPGSPRLFLGTEYQVRLNTTLLVFTFVFTLKLMFSLIETSRTLRSKSVLAYTLTSLIPVTTIIFLLILSYVNIAIFSKSFVLSDRFLERLKNHAGQLLAQDAIRNIIKYAPNNKVVNDRIGIDRFGIPLRDDFGIKPFFKIRYIKRGKVFTIVSRDTPEELKSCDLPPDWYFSSPKLSSSSGFKEHYRNIFPRHVANADRTFIRKNHTDYYFTVAEYADDEVTIYLSLCLPMTDKVLEYMSRSFVIQTVFHESIPEEDTSLLSSSFHIRDAVTGKVLGSISFSFYDSLSQLLFASLGGEHDFNRFLRVFRNTMFGVLLLFFIIIFILTLVGRKIDRNMRLALQTIVLGMRRIGEGNLDYKIELRSRDEYYRLASSINDMTSDLKQFMEDRVEKERLKAEVKTAYTIQRSILPERDPDIKGIDISSYIKPAEEVGGDFYDYLPREDGSLGIVIGDVSGHGVSAGMLMAMAKSCLYNQSQHSVIVGKVMEAMNKMVFDTVQKRLLMTFLYANINAKKKRIEFSNAGHHFPYIYRPKEKKLSTLNYPSYPLGVRRNTKYKKKSVSLEKGDFLIFYSDGIIEQINQEDELFGFDRLEKLLSESSAKSAEEMKDLILDKLETFAEGRPRFDDITLIVIHLQ